MITVNEVPFLRFLIPMIIGITIGEYLSYDISWIYLLVGLFLGLFLAICAYQLKWKVTCSFFVHVLLFCLGCISIQTQNARVTQDPILISENSKANIIGTVSEVEVKEKGYYVTIQNLAYQDTSNFHWLKNKAKGKIYLACTVDGGKINSEIEKGDTLSINAIVSYPSAPSNKNDFDYATHLRRNGITYQSYVPKGHWSNRKRKQNNLTSMIDDSRSYCQSVLNKYIHGEDERAIASALILGNRNYLSSEITTAYVETGSMHVLAVSGLHVLIVAGFLNFLLSLICRNNIRLQFVRIGLTVMGVWMFATLTGFSPSVIRASIMFSVIAIGILINRGHSIINSICFSAMVMLVYDPAMLFNVGFQFSYLAVFGIILLHKNIFPSIQPENKVLKFITDCCKVSVAAQLFVLPVSVYYFHTTSTLFWLSSPIVIIYAYMIIPIGLLMLILSKMSNELTTLASYPLEYLISSFHQVVKNIQIIPYSSINHIYVDGVMFTLVCTLVMLLTLYLLQPKSKILHAMCICTIIILGYRGTQKIETINQRKVIVYQSSKTNYMDIMIGETVYSYYTNELSPKEEKNLTYSTRLRSGSTRHIDLSKHTSYIDKNIKLENNTLYVMDKMIKIPSNNKSETGFKMYEYTIDDIAQYAVTENTITRQQYTQIDCVGNKQFNIN